MANARAYYDEGVDLLAARKFNEAIQKFTLSLSVDASFALAFRKRGEAFLLLQDDYASAIHDFTNAIELDPKDPVSFMLRGFAYVMHEGQYEAAEYDFLAIERLAFAYSVHEYAILELYRVDEFQKKLMERLDTAIQSHSDAKGMRTCRLVLCIADKQYQRALPDLEYLQSQGKYADVLWKCGEVFIGLGNKEKALKCLSKSIKILMTPSMPNHLCNRSFLLRAGIYTDQKEFDLALADLNKFIELNPKDADGYKARAQLLKKMDKSAAAVLDEEKAFARSKQPASLLNICKFHFLRNHGQVMAYNSVRRVIENAPEAECHATNKIRKALAVNNITPDTIDLMRQSQGCVTGTRTIFDEIRAEEEFYFRVSRRR